MKFSILLVSAILVLTTYGVAQSATGIPPFSSTTAGPDVINLGNLNIHFCVPIVTKPGRGIPFTYSLCFDNSIWSPAGVSGSQNWQPAPNWGWEVQTSALVGYVAQQVSTGSCNYGYRGQSVGHYTVTVYPYYVDQSGTSHTFTPTPIIVYNDSGGSPGGCGPSQSNYSTVGSATDGSGMSFDANLRQVTFKNGTTIVPPVQTMNGAGTVTDSNGNQISTPGTGTFTDTLGLTALTISGTAPSNTVYQYTDSNGQLQSITVAYDTTHPVQTNFQCSGISQYGPTNTFLISTITFPDNSYYQFSYESTPTGTGVASGAVTGRVSSIRLPSGGTISYTYPAGSTNGIVCGDGTTSAVTRQTPDGATTYSRSNLSGTEWQTLIIDAYSNQTTMWFQSAGGNFYETRRQVGQNNGNGQTVLRTIDSCYNGSSWPCLGTAVALPINEVGVLTYLENNWQSITRTYYNAFTLPTETDEYDFANGTSGPLLRKTLTTYASLGTGIVDRVSSVTIQDGGGNQKAQTNYYYDQGSLTTTSGVPQHIGISGSRGNLTEISQWLNTTGGYLNTNLAYDDTGNVLSSTDPGGHSTSFQYSNANAYVHQVTLPQTGSVQHITYANYDSNTGLVTSAVDQNNQTTTYTYDCMMRKVKIGFPDGGEIDTGYNSAPNPTNPPCTTASPNYIETKQKQDASNWIDQYTYLDSLGRTHQAMLVDPEGNDYVDTNYDANGRIYSVSNPYRTTSDPTYGTTTYAYDALNRVTQITEPDGNQQQATYSGVCTTTSDETGRPKQLCSDGFGRLTSVVEPNPTSGSLTSGSYPTYYSYDALNNLTQISQQGDGSGARNRSFTFDSLSRLLDATNPETGILCYGTMSGSSCNRDGYDADGNLVYKTDARQIRATYSYDQLHRMVQAAYSDGTPMKTWIYDPSSISNSSGTFVSSNSIGRLVEHSNNVNAGSFYAYDAMGRITRQDNCTPSNCAVSSNPIVAQYDLAGNPISLTYPSGRKIAESYSAAGRLLNVNFDSFNGTAVNYSYWTASQAGTWQNAGYWPTGSLHLVSLGNGTSEATDFNPRLQQTTALLGAPTGWNVNSSNRWLSKTFSLYDCCGHDNGNILTITDTLNANHTQQYGYDYLNRISMGLQNDGAFNQSFSLDPWGNLKQSGTFAFGQNFDANNRIAANQGYLYDAAGNLTNDTFHNYAFDAEGRLKTVDTSAASYTYDADGNRVRKDVSGRVRS